MPEPPPDAPLTRTYRARSWLVPTLVVIVVLVTVVAVGRFGQTPGEVSATASPTNALAVATRRPPGPRASLSVRVRPVYADAARLIGSSIGVRSDEDRYDDGIPSTWDGDPVVRVRDAAALPVGSVALVGGWALRVPCPSGEGASPCLALLSDVPFRSARVAVLALGGQAAFDYSQGPRIFRASVQTDPSCTQTAFDACLPRLITGSPVWQGDDETASGPIASDLLLGALASRFPTLDFQPFAEASSCPVSWPVQTYVVSAPDAPRALWPALPVRLVLAFANPAQLDDQIVALRKAAAAMTPFEASNRCVAVPGGVDDNAWIVRDNVMVLLGPEDATVQAQVDGALDEVPRTLSGVSGPF